jgi:pSer/pThr/pTyr-binding forkhead associated (FHA) protein
MLEISLPGEEGAARRIVLPIGFDTMVGRSEGVGLKIDDPRISRHHARLVHDERGVVLTDWHSTNGTSVNGRQLTEPCRLHDKDVVSFAGVEAVFRAADSRTA